MFNWLRKYLRKWIAPETPKGFTTRMYAGAKQSRLTESWGNITTSSDSELSTSLRILRARSRALMRDAPFAKRAKVIVVNNVIGPGIGIQGQVTILPDITQATSQTDLRSSAKKNLDMIEARIAGDTSPDVMSYSIGGRSLSKRSFEELISMRSYWKTEYERELEAEGIARGEDNPRRIGVRFRRV